MELAAWCYPHLRQIGQKHRLAIRRAAQVMARRLGRDWRGIKWGAKIK